MNPMSTRILIVYDTNGGNAYRMAQQIARGVDKIAGCEAIIRAVPKVSAKTTERDAPVPESGAPYADVKQLAEVDGLIIGSPTHFGNMSASLKHFIDQSTAYWIKGSLAGKPGAAFTSTGSMHGGQETTLISMMLPLLHHGMLIVGLPYTDPGLSLTSRGGTPYGASHVSGEQSDQAMDQIETTLCHTLGARVAQTALRLKA